MPGTRKPDVVVIGGGTAGMVVAAESTARGLGTVVLEAGAWRHPQRDFSGDEWDMLHPADGVLRWGPTDRAEPPYLRELEGLGAVFQAAGVGGTGNMGWGASPRGMVRSFERGWPFGYRHLIEWYERIEEALPVRIPEALAPKDEAFLEGCRRLGLDHLLGPDTDKIGWRFQPNAILPLTAAATPTFPEADGCTACGGCISGCRQPENAPLERTAMRNGATSFAPGAYATGLLDLRTDCQVVGIVAEPTSEGLHRVRAVRYRTQDGKVIEQDGERFVLTAGAIESPRIYLASGLPDNGWVGRGLTTHALDLVAGVLPEEVDPSVGQVSMARCDFPGFGSVFSLGLTPLLAALAYGSGHGISHGHGPWATDGFVVGADLKRRMEKWRRTLFVGVSVDDEVDGSNGVRLSSGASDTAGPVPSIRYVPTDETLRRRDWLARRASEILVEAGADPASVHRFDLLGLGLHLHGTLRMGGEGNGVVSAEGRFHSTTNLYCADASILPTSLGGADPALTVQACASMISERIAATLD
ncbi:MAG: GMC oxidoreductase [Actinomycetota bacterium]